MVLKQAPQTTFLSSVAGVATKSAESHEAKPAAASPSPGQMLILTILSQTSGSVPKAVLVDRFAASDLRADVCEQALGELISGRLVEDRNGYVLTPSGRAAAERARANLLSPW